jgi:hypothetical protein
LAEIIERLAQLGVRDIAQGAAPVVSGFDP